jgi:hypothetical protein
MNERNTELLEKRVQEAGLIREMCSTPGFKLIKQKFEEKIQKATSRLLDMSTTDEEIKSIRLKLSVWTEITSMLKSFLLTGEYASHTLNEDLDVNSLANSEQGDK